MTAWREVALQSPPGTPCLRVARLPVSRCRRGSCDACFSRQRRAAKRGFVAPPAVPIVSTTSIHPLAKRARATLPAVGHPSATSSLCPPEADCPRPSLGVDTGPAADALLRPDADVGDVAPAALPAEVHPEPSCQAFLDYLLSGGVGRTQDESILWRIASAILLHADRDQICLQQKNGRPRVYVRQVSPRKVAVKRSQENKRRAAARRQLMVAGVVSGVDSEGSVCAGGGPARVNLSHRQQVGIVFELGISWSAFNKLRRAMGGRESGLASRHVLRAAKKELADSPAKQVVVTTTGAHLANLAMAVQERVTALCDAGRFVERFVYGADRKPLRAEDAVVPGDFEIGAWGGRPLPTVPDVHITVGLDKGGEPASEKIVLSIVNQDRPNNPSNTILAAVCPCTKDKYPEVSAMMATHTAGVNELLQRGLDVRGERRPVRLLLSGDLESQCTVVGHKGPSATMPCIQCKSTKAPTVTHSTLDAKYGTLQDVSGPWRPREAGQYVNWSANESKSNQDDHLSVTRRPLLSPHPRQIVPIPVHLTLGITSRVLRLSVEVVIRCCGRSVASDFAYELAELLYTEAHVHPVPYHGGLFIGRDCHAIGEHSDAVCAALEGKLSGAVAERGERAMQYLQAYKDAWGRWNGVRKVLNRATIATAAEASAFRSDVAAFVAGLKRSFGWVNLSPKLHILLAHAPDFLDEFGSIGLYGEQGLEAWHGRYTQTARLYPGESDLASAAAFVRAMTLAGDASPAVVGRGGPQRASAKDGAHKATKAGDGRLRANKPAVPLCDETQKKAEHERELWADKVFAVAAETMVTYEGRLQNQAR